MFAHLTHTEILKKKIKILITCFVCLVSLPTILIFELAIALTKSTLSLTWLVSSYGSVVAVPGDDWERSPGRDGARECGTVTLYDRQGRV